MFSLTDIIGRNRQKVEKSLGIAENVYPVELTDSSAAIKAYYQKGRIIIVYVDNTADWITIDGQEGKIIEEFFRFLGVRTRVANFKYQGIIKYFNLAGLEEIAIYGNYEGRIDRICIKAFTKLIP